MEPFLSTLPARGATREAIVRLGKIEFLSTLPARGATCSFGGCACNLGISIHAPREGSDVLSRAQLARQIAISIHAPREGSDINSMV